MLQTPLRHVDNLPLAILMAVGAILVMAVVLVVIVLVIVKLKQPENTHGKPVDNPVVENPHDRQH